MSRPPFSRTFRQIGLPTENLARRSFLSSQILLNPFQALLLDTLLIFSLCNFEIMNYNRRETEEDVTVVRYAERILRGGRRVAASSSVASPFGNLPITPEYRLRYKKRLPRSGELSTKTHSTALPIGLRRRKALPQESSQQNLYHRPG